MKKSLMLLLLISVFSISCFASKDVTKISKAEQSLYEKNPWDYLEKILSKTKHCSSITKTTIDYIMGTIFFVPLAFSTYWVHAVDAVDDTATLIIDYTIIQPCVAMLSGMGAYLFNKFTKHFLRKRIKKEKLVHLLEALLKKYDPDLDEDSNKVNYKKIIPSELHELFDGLHKKYIKHGKKYLMKHNLYFINLIRQKIRNRYEYPPTIRVLNY